MGTPRRPLRTPATIRPVLRSSPRRYQPPAPAMTAPRSAATATICTIRRARDFMDSQYQTVPRNQDSRSGWAPRIAIMGPDRDHIYGQPRQRQPLWATGTTGRRRRGRARRAWGAMRGPPRPAHTRAPRGPGPCPGRPPAGGSRPTGAAYGRTRARGFRHARARATTPGPTREPRHAGAG